MHLNPLHMLGFGGAMTSHPKCYKNTRGNKYYKINYALYKTNWKNHMAVRKTMTLEEAKEVLKLLELRHKLPFESYAAEIDKIDAEFTASMTEIEADPSLKIDKLCGPVECAVEAAVPITGTQSITIRMPRRILAAFKRRAKSIRVPYQTLMVRELNISVRKLA